MLIDIATLSITNPNGIAATIPNLCVDTYFFDTDTRTVKSRKSGSLSTIYGAIKGSHRWYSFMNRYGRAVSIREDSLKQAVMKYTDTTVSAPATNGATSKHGWIIGSVTGSQYSFSTTPRVHETENSVNTEIERLAKANPGKRFVKVRIEAFVQAGGVSWS